MPLRPRSVEEPPRIRRRRDVVAVVLAWVFIVMMSWLIIATVPETEARARRRQTGMEKALASLRIVRIDEQRYHRVNGRYANWLRLYEGKWPSTRADQEAHKHLYVRTSADGQAYLSTQRWSDYRVECAELVRNGPGTAASRALDTGSWKLGINAPPRCRKTGWPWQWLHGAGLGYLDVSQAGAVGG